MASCFNVRTGPDGTVIVAPRTVTAVAISVAEAAVFLAVASPVLIPIYLNMPDAAWFCYAIVVFVVVIAAAIAIYRIGVIRNLASVQIRVNAARRTIEWTDSLGHSRVYTYTSVNAAHAMNVDRTGVDAVARPTATISASVIDPDAVGTDKGIAALTIVFHDQPQYTYWLMNKVSAALKNG